MKRINNWRAVYDSKESKNPWEYPPKFAIYLDVEPTNNCNFNCKFCVSKQAKRERGYLSLDTHKLICDQAKQYGAYGIRYLRWGEPLLHKDIDTMVSYAHNLGLLTHITTNGSLLSIETSKKLVNAGLDDIIISMQGTNKKEYNNLRGHNYEECVSGLYNLLDIRGNNKFPYITISTTVTNESDDEIEKFKNYWLNYVDDITIGYTWFKRLNNKEPVLDYIEKSKKLPHLFKCQEVMTKLSIDWDGNVSPCCLDYDRELNIGNINKDNLYDLWKSDNLNAIRLLLTNKMQDIFTLCRTCELNYDFRGKL